MEVQKNGSVEVHKYRSMDVWKYRSKSIQFKGKSAFGKSGNDFWKEIPYYEHSLNKLVSY